MPQPFIADAMLLKLARWLRIFGADVEYAAIPDNELLALLKAHPRKVLLTQDVQLHERAQRRGLKSFLVPRGVPMEEQIASIFKEFRLKLEDFPSKTVCPECNGELKTVGKKEVKGRILENIYKRHKKFWLCAKCGKVYWEGSHWKRINETAKKVGALLSNPESPGA